MQEEGVKDKKWFFAVLRSFHLRFLNPQSKLNRNFYIFSNKDFSFFSTELILHFSFLLERQIFYNF
jgi:hypothetical protein